MACHQILIEDPLNSHTRRDFYMPLPWQQRAAISAEEAAEILYGSRAKVGKVRARLRAGILQGKKDGREWLVFTQQLREMGGEFELAASPVSTAFTSVLQPSAKESLRKEVARMRARCVLETKNLRETR